MSLKTLSAIQLKLPPGGQLPKKLKTALRVSRPKVGEQCGAAERCRLGRNGRASPHEAGGSDLCRLAGTPDGRGACCLSSCASCSTGVSGTGKSSLVKELRRRGYVAFDADDDGFTAPTADGAGDGD